MHWIDPACLPETTGTVTQFLLNPHGEPDGLILDGERQVHFPPHLGPRIVQCIAPGDVIVVRGVKPRDADIVAAVSIAPVNGEPIVDEGPGHDHDKHGRHREAEPRPGEVAGTVVLSLYGPKGELRGACLGDGTSLRMAPHAAEELRDWLAPGARVQAWGDLVETAYGRTLDVSEMAEQAHADPGT